MLDELPDCAAEPVAAQDRDQRREDDDAAEGQVFKHAEAHFWVPAVEQLLTAIQHQKRWRNTHAEEEGNAEQGDPTGAERLAAPANDWR